MYSCPFRENFPPDVIRPDICPREDETKFRLSFDRSIVSLLEDKIRENTILFSSPYFSFSLDRKEEEVKFSGIVLVVSSWKINWKTDSDFEKCFENHVEK